ncbi:endonuclease-reverse transcriptase [Holotrichia oblita]|uniref:Endonuclease-reverse transcriptase n=1 Tax=Holotrichia oblita TaxID=644536 RepID=A0ACB9TZ91_HOLOL|nr:endonuclease-reverse transcriptase [Holotrichia oblita]
MADADLRSCFKCFVIESNPIIEQIWISIRVKSMDLSVGCVYRPPNSSGDLFINTIELQLINCNLTFPLVLGDMNIDFLDGNSQLTLKLKQCLNSLNMTQLIKEPTRVARSSATLLDLIVISDARIINESIVNPSEISDHDLVYCRIKLSFNNTLKFITYRDYSAFDYDAFLLDLQRIPFHFMFNMSVDSKIIFFKQQILSLFDHHAPIRKVRITKSPVPQFYRPQSSHKPFQKPQMQTVQPVSEPRPLQQNSTQFKFAKSPAQLQEKRKFKPVPVVEIGSSRVTRSNSNKNSSTPPGKPKWVAEELYYQAEDEQFNLQEFDNEEGAYGYTEVQQISVEEENEDEFSHNTHLYYLISYYPK